MVCLSGLARPWAIITGGPSTFTKLWLNAMPARRPSGGFMMHSKAMPKLIKWTEVALTAAFFVLILLLRVYFFIIPRLREYYLWLLSIMPMDQDRER